MPQHPRLSSLVSRSAIVAAATIALPACSFSPINHRVKVGQESFIVFVGDGIDHNVDLFAVPAGGGAVAQVTFTPLIERAPRLSPTGEYLAFLRMRDSLPSTPRIIVVMNLLGGGEKTLDLPPDAGTPTALGWARDSVTLYVRTDRGTWSASVAPAPAALKAVTPDRAAAADSVLDIWLGEPRFARVIGCATGGLCIFGPKGDTTSLAPLGSEPVRWGTDSVAWFQQGGIIVRSLGPGRERRVTWTGGPANPREVTYAAGPSS